MRSAMNPEQIPVHLYEQTRPSAKMAAPFLGAI